MSEDPLMDAYNKGSAGGEDIGPRLMLCSGADLRRLGYPVPDESLGSVFSVYIRDGEVTTSREDGV